MKTVRQPTSNGPFRHAQRVVAAAHDERHAPPRDGHSSPWLPRWRALVGLLLVLAGCGPHLSGPERDVQELRDWFRRKLPAGWQVGTAREAGFPVLPPTKADDLVLWKSEPVALEWRTEPVAAQMVAHVYFTLARVEWVEPAEFAELHRKNEALRKQHDHYRARMTNVPRDADGNFMPRGVAEASALRSVQKEYAKLPPYRTDLPTHYYRRVAWQVHDWRTVLVPAEREVQQEQNRVFALFNEIMKRYPTR
jgi:hypothetical protein